MPRWSLKSIGLTLTILWLTVHTAAAGPYKIATVAWIGWSPLHVAMEKGFWRDRGLDVTVVTYDDPIVILEAMKAGKIDFAMDMVGSLVGIYMRGEPVVAIAETNWSHGGDKIIIRKGDRLNRHMGGAIGVFLDQPSCLFFLGRYLQTVGRQLRDFRIVEINPRDLSAQFIAGRLPIIVNYEPWADNALNRGNGMALATSATFPGCIPECLWAYRDTLQTLPAGAVQDLLHGWIKAVQWLQTPENQAAYFNILRSRTFKDEKGLSHEELSRMIGEVVIHNAVQLKERNRDGGGLQLYLAALKQFLAQNGRLQKDWQPADLFDNHDLMRVLNQLSNGRRPSSPGQEMDP